MIRSLFLFAITFLIVGCADLGYYWHSAKGHLAIMNKRVPISELITNPETDSGLKQRLMLVKDIRRFATDQLSLPESGSYTDYAQLDRPYALQNLFAAPEFSIKLLSWCYPIVGCASYRGFYDQQRLDNFVETLRADSNDIHIGRVPAYSTLGWFDDPVLSSFIDWPDHRLAGLLFHELSHQRLYIDDDTQFNESMASAVQQVGIRLWLRVRQQQNILHEYNRSILYRRDMVLLIEAARIKLSKLYQSDESDSFKRERKKQIFDQLRREYREVVMAHHYIDAYGNWFARELNNAKLASVSTYNAKVPAFVNMINAFDNDFDRFFDYAESISKLDKDKRNACLLAWRLVPAFEDESCR